MLVYVDEPELGPCRSAFKRFNAKRISLFGTASAHPSPIHPTSHKMSTPPDHDHPDSSTARWTTSATKRKAPQSPYLSNISPSASPDLYNPPSHTAALDPPFTNPSPFTSKPLTPRPPALSRLPSENRAALANEYKAAEVAMEVSPGKRRKSVVDVEDATERMRHLAARRRSSLTPIQISVATRRAPVNRFTPPPDDVADLVSSVPSVPAFQSCWAKHASELVFPSSSPPINSERRFAFSDEPSSPLLSCPAPPSFSRPRSVRTTPSPSSPRPCSNLFHTMSGCVGADPPPHPVKAPRSSHVQAASGVHVTYPLVFPSRPRPAARTCAVREQDEAEEAEDDLEAAKSEEGKGVEESTTFRQAAVRRRVSPPSLASASPFPPPFLSLSMPTSTNDSFSDFDFPRLPTLFPETPAPIPPRRLSTSSSYDSCIYTQDDGVVKTTSTLELHPWTPSRTGCTSGGGDPFAEAFGFAALRPPAPRDSTVATTRDIGRSS